MTNRKLQAKRGSRIVTWLMLAAAVLVLATGCASTASDGQERQPRDVLTRAQLDAVDHLNAFDAIRRYKPLWLRTKRGQDSFVSQGRRGLRVYVDRVFFGGVASLRNIDVRNIEEIRFLDKRKATTELGTDHAEGAILISTRT